MKRVTIFLVFFILFVCFSALSQQRIHTENGWNFTGMYATLIDSSMTGNYNYGTSGQLFKNYGISWYPELWNTCANWDKIFPNLITPDKVSVDFMLQKEVNVDSVKVCIALQDSTGSYYAIGERKTTLRDSSWQTIEWDLSIVKDFGIKSFNRFYIIFQTMTGDSCYVGSEILVRNLKGIDDTLGTYIIDFGSTTGVEQEQIIPKGFVLEQNYPNPFNPTTTFSFHLSSSSFVSLKIFDEIGREVTTLVSKQMSTGNHTKQWDANGMPSGIYFYRLQVGLNTETKKMLLLK